MSSEFPDPNEVTRWPDGVPTAAEVHAEMQDILQGGGEDFTVLREQLAGWSNCIGTCAMMLEEVELPEENDDAQA